MSEEQAAPRREEPGTRLVKAFEEMASRIMNELQLQEDDLRALRRRVRDVGSRVRKLEDAAGRG